MDAVVGDIVLKTPIQWEININCFQNKEIGDAVLSPIFITQGHNRRLDKWRLKLYPKGKNEECSGSLSLFLLNVSENDLNVMYSLALLNEDNIKVVDIKSKKAVLFKTRLGHGYKNFVSENFVTDSNNKILSDQKLRIVFSIIVKEYVAESNSEVDNEQISCRCKSFDDFGKLLMDKDLSDVTVTVADGQSFNLHKCILSARSIVFEKMFKNDMKEKVQSRVEIEDLTYDVLEEFFQFVYTGKVSGNAENIICGLLTASEKYCVEELKALCEKIMASKLNNKNAIDYITSALMNNAEKLQSDVINYISLQIDNFIKVPEFDTFGIQHPKVLLEIIKKLRNA